MRRPFRFACRATGGQPRTAMGWRDLAIRAEALGYDTFAVSDHFATAYAPLMVLQLVATCASTLRLATLVLDNDFRHPAVLAKETATLDVLSDGRLELGMGAGWLALDYELSGIPFEAGGLRVARLRESLQVLKLLFGGGPVSFSGRFWALRGMELLPRPAQRPRPPLLVGGTGPRLLRMAAREADIVSFDSGPATQNPASWTWRRWRRRPDWSATRRRRPTWSSTSTRTSGRSPATAARRWTRRLAPPASTRTGSRTPPTCSRDR